MTTIQEIEFLVRQTEKENIKTELKSFRKLFPHTRENKTDIAAEIVAIANRQGGKLIFGINDDGSFDGKLKAQEIDEAKGWINNICKDLISPAIDCTIQFIETQEKDVVIVYIPQKKSIPHAVTEKSGPNIKHRTYYVRTNHGKSLVTDSQLEWMFTNATESTFGHPFRLAFEFDKDFNFIQGIVPIGNFTVSPFIWDLSQEERELLKKDNDALRSFFVEMMPYLFLKSVADIFARSWYIGITEEFDRRYYGAKITSTPFETQEITVASIPVTGHSFIRQYKWDFEKILLKHFERAFNIPQGTKMSIKYEKNDRSTTGSCMIMEHEGFLIKLSFFPLNYGAGLHPRSVLTELFSERMGHNFQKYSMNNYIHFDGGGRLTAEFKYPEYDMSQYKEFYEYYDSLKKLIDTNWSYDVARKEFPPKEILVISDKLDQIRSHFR
jgi:hypothetical protein